MAITADYTVTTYTAHETDTEDVTITYPDNFPDSTLAGTTETVTQPVMVASTSTSTQKYVVITHYTYYKEVKDDSDNNLLDVQFKVYDSAADKESDENSHIAEGEVLGTFHNVTSSTDIRVKGYEVLKADTRFSNITDS